MINSLNGKFGTVNLLHLRNAILEWLDTWKRSVYLLSFLECCAMNTVSMVGAVWNYTFFNTQLTCGFIFSLQPLFAWIRKIQIDIRCSCRRNILNDFFGGDRGGEYHSHRQHHRKRQQQTAKSCSFHCFSPYVTKK